MNTPLNISNQISSKTYHYTYLQILLITVIYILFFYFGITYERTEVSFLIILFILDVCLLLFSGNTFYEIVYKTHLPQILLSDSRLSKILWFVLWGSLIAGFIASLVSHSMMLTTFSKLNYMYTNNTKLANDINIPLMKQERKQFNNYKAYCMTVITLFIFLFCILINKWIPAYLFANIGSFLSYLLLFSIVGIYIKYTIESVLISNFFWPLYDRVLIE